VDPACRALDLARLVDHDVVVVGLPGELEGRVPLADVELVGGFCGPGLEAPEEILERRRDEEDQEGLGDLLLHDRGALDVDLEDHVMTLAEGVPDVGPRGAIPVAVDLVRLEQLGLVAEAHELGLAEEVVVDVVDLIRPPGPGRAGHDVVVVRVAGHPPDLADDAVLADPGRSRDDDEERPRRARLGAVERRLYLHGDGTLRPEPSPLGVAPTAYSYDPNDNRLYRNESAGSQTKYLYNDDSSLDRREVRWLGDLRVTNDYAYDENGNRVWNLENIIGRGLTTYTYEYDLEDRLVRILSDSYEMVSYAYFNDGSRVRRTASSGSTYFLYDFQDFNGYADIIAEYDSAGMLKARYIHGPGIDEPLAKEYAGQWYYYHADGLGSVTMLTRADKTVANRYVYDDYGAFRSRTEAIPNPYAYTGREYDSAVDLIYYRARYYDAITGRFLTRDPQGMDDGPNVYTYARNNPTSRTDPSGTRFSDKDPFFNPFAPDPGGPGLGGGDKADCKVGEQGRGHGYGKCKDRGDGNPPPPPPPPAATPPPRDIQWGLVVAGIALLAVCLIFLWFVAPFIMGLLATIWSAAQAATEASVFASLLFIGGVTVGMLFIIPCGGAVWLILVGFNFV